jgi:catechol 2,3-dioxygenase-like lactoylglutathione lyase family enzyme
VITAGVHHVAVNVDDLDAALRFYTEGFGFVPRTDRPDFGIAGAWLDMGSHQLHLVEIPGERAPDSGGHFALRVDDLDAVVTTLRDRGIEVFDSPHFPGAGHQAFVRDPANNLIELNEPD